MAPKILIVDDEKIARENIRFLLRKRGEQFAIQEAANGAEALAAIKEFQPDVVFLDIEMPGFSGFDVLYAIEDRNFQVVFQTAYSEFAIKAFEVNACDYLLKPFSDERFYQSLDRVLAGGGSGTGLKELDRYLVAEKQYLKRLLIPVGRGTKVVEVSKAMYFTSDEHYTRVWLEDGDFVSDLSLQYLEEHLSPELFVRIHRNAMINKRHVQTLLKGRPAYLLMKNGQRLRIPKERLGAVKTALRVE